MVSYSILLAKLAKYKLEKRTTRRVENMAVFVENVRVENIKGLLSVIQSPTDIQLLVVFLLDRY